MKKLLLSAVGLIALGATSPVFAADMAVRAAPMAPPPIAMIYDWSGFYIGVNGGWGNSHNCWNFDPAFVTPGGVVVTGDGCRDRSGGLFGGQVGYRWQGPGQFVFGLEAQGDWADLSSSRVSLLDPTLSTNTKTDAIGLFTAQFGWAWNTALLYVKGGAAVTNNTFTIFDTLTGIGLASASATRWGGTLGVGFEYAFAPNWSIGAEYDHLWMGHANNSFSIVDPRVAGILNNRISQDVDMFTLRINYRFGGYPYGAPVAARY